MVSKRAFVALMLATSLTGSASAALASDRSARPTPNRPIVVTLNPQFNGSMAALFFVGDRVLNALRVVTGVGLVKGPDHGTLYETHGIQDGADPTGVKDSRLPSGGPFPVPATNHRP